MTTLFLLDTNFFIQSHRTNYPLDVATGFWNKVKSLAHNRRLQSIDKVKKEIYEKEDEIKEWCAQNLPNDFFVNTETQNIIQQYKKVIAWANSMFSRYTPRAIDEFAEYENADAWLISYALTMKNTITIVTYEVSEPERKNKVKIPDVCNHFTINCIGVIEMFRQLGETF